MMDRACNKNKEDTNTYRILLENSKGKRPLGTPRRMRVDNIKMALRGTGWWQWTGLVSFRIGIS
jgi:hypothetical protein